MAVVYLPLFHVWVRGTWTPSTHRLVNHKQTVRTLLLAVRLRLFLHSPSPNPVTPQVQKGLLRFPNLLPLLLISLLPTRPQHLLLIVLSP